MCLENLTGAVYVYREQHGRDEASEQEAARVAKHSCCRGRRREHKCERLEETKNRKEDNNNNN